MIIHHDNYIEAKLPIESPLPSTLDILHRFKQRYSKRVREALEPVLYSCAEETDRIIGDLVYSKYKIRSVSMKVVRYETPGNYTIRTRGYCCPSCNGKNIHYPFKHCPDCGKQIKWNE